MRVYRPKQSGMSDARHPQMFDIGYGATWEDSKLTGAEAWKLCRHWRRLLGIRPLSPEITVYAQRLRPAILFIVLLANPQGKPAVGAYTKTPGVEVRWAKLSAEYFAAKQNLEAEREGIGGTEG